MKRTTRARSRTTSKRPSRGDQATTIADLLAELAKIPGPPGREDGVRQRVHQLISGRADLIETSPLGALHAVVGRGGQPRTMIAAHMDEVGLIISHIDPSGFARFGLLGRKDPAGLIGHTAEFPGGRMAVLRVETDSKDEAISVDKLFLDFGSSGPGQVEINVGDVGCLANGQHRLGDRFVRSNAGGRSAVVTLIRVLQSLERPTAELQFVFSVQGEFGGDGGRTSAASLEPQAALVIAPAPSGDTPGKASQTIRLGGGPVIVIRHGSVASDARMVEAIVSQADKSRIACQMAALEFELPGSTMPAANDGLITAWVCIPCRGLGSTAEMVDMGDIDATVRLLTALSQSRLEWL